MEACKENRNSKKIIDRRVLSDRRLADDSIMAGYERRSMKDRRKDNTGIKHHSKNLK